MMDVYSYKAAAPAILEPANPMSLCVEFLAARRGNIRLGVGEVPMSHTGEARDAFRHGGIRDARDA